ncbi:MAG: Ig-like domain-containing protein, partial [Candidatus Mariimomonas ferrooxydans]
MIKRFLLSIAFFTIIVLLAGCGGSGGTTGIPRGVNPGIPSVVQLLPLQIVAQTNSYIDFRAKVLDGNGNPVKNERVTFTNLSSPFGTLSSTVRYTDSLGFATVTLYSTTSGFATVQAEVDTGAGWVRDRRTVYFTTGSLNLYPYLILDVDG